MSKFKPGDLVMGLYPQMDPIGPGAVIAVDGDKAWVRWPELDGDTCRTVWPLARLEPAPIYETITITVESEALDGWLACYGTLKSFEWLSGPIATAIREARK